MRRVLVAVLVAASLTGCPSKPAGDGPGPSESDKKVPGAKAENPYAVDIVTICMATETTPKGQNPDDAPKRATDMAAYIKDHLKTAEGRLFFSELMAVAPTDKAKLLRDESKAKGGGGNCPLADWYETTAAKIPAPGPSTP
jgi:hypothetical protein